MKSVRTILVLVLAATTVGGAVVAWRQYTELVELRAAAMNRSERADLHKRVWDLEKANRALQDQLAVQRDPLVEMENPAPPVEGERGERPERGGRGEARGRGGNPLQQVVAVRELMAKPEVQALLNLQQKAGIEGRYAALFRNLNLPPEQVEKLKTLLAERTTTLQDTAAAAREAGISPRENPEEYRKAIENARDDINASIKSVIGETGFAQLTTYEQTLPQRNLVNELQQRLSYSSTPLTPAQAEQMVQILASTAPQRTTNGGAPGTPNEGGGGGRGPAGGFGGRGGDLGGIVGALGGGPGLGMLIGALDGGNQRNSLPVTAAAVAQAQAVLAPTQLAALQQIQQQQQAQQQLQQLLRDTLNANSPATNRAAPSPAGSNASSGATPPATAPKRGGSGG